ncbi:amino acid adenylation domain-containing protein [Leptothoe sp. EHU-05/26/07-4]
MMIEKASTYTCNNLSDRVYWLNKLSGELPETNFVVDYVRPEFYRGKNDFIEFQLNDQLSQTINSFSNGSHYSIYLFLLSALKILLAKHTGNDDSVIGIPCYQPVGEDIGDRLSSKLIPLRLNITDEIAFKDILLKVRDSVINAYVHQNYSFDELIETLDLPQSENRCPIYDIVVLLENIHDQCCASDVNNDLTVIFRVNENKIIGRVDYAQALFRNNVIDIFIQQYIYVIECIVNDPHIKVSDIALLEGNEKHQVLKEFNRNIGSGYPIDRTIYELFEEQVSRTPNEVAVVFEKEVLTYSELKGKVNELAGFLQDIGIARGEFVGIYKERDIDFLISIIAILGAGGAYVPIDSTYPPERIKHMLSNSGVEILLTDCSSLSGLIDDLQNHSHLRHLVCLDEDDKKSLSLQQSSIDIHFKSDFSNLSKKSVLKDYSGEANRGTYRAYMLYTSGSTGLPKGTIIRHDGAINHIYAQFEALDLREGFDFLQSAPASSDISVWQFLGPLLTGGRTVIVDTETVCDPEKLFKVVKDERLTIVELVPAVLRELLNYVSQLSDSQRLLPDLRWMMVTGEYVSVELINQWLRFYPSIKIVNAYGPTEAADDITQFIIEEPLPENLRTVPIGKPLANLSLYILDPRMRLMPIGVPGEICVSGIGVGNGYWKNKEKTNLSFIPNPFPNLEMPLPEGNRDLIYKTGDLGRWLPDGNIEFLGRIDNQVKIRGFRIELGEIESLLVQYPTVRDVVVLVRKSNGGDEHLIAYFVPSAEVQVLQEEEEEVQQSAKNSVVISKFVSKLRNFLKGKLPEYMIPSIFVPLERVPLVPSGKVDRKALLAMNVLPQDRQQSYVAPHTPIQEVIAGIWTQVLGLEKVGINDNFFERGGHSLLATQLMSRLRNVFHIELPLREIFECPTVAALAKSVEAMKHSQDILPVPAVIPAIPKDGNLPLSFAQERLWFLDQLEIDSTTYNMPSAVRLEGELNLTALEQSFTEIVRRHEILRTVFVVSDGQPSQVVMSSSPFKLPVVDLRALPEVEREAEVLRLIAQEVDIPFDLTKDRLLRIKLLQLGLAEYVMLFTMHHIATDAWSNGVLTRELSVLYQAFCSGNFDRQRIKLADLPIQYADFAYWQRHWLQGEVLEKHLSYWRQQLAGISTTLNLQKLAGKTALVTSEKECAAQSFLIPANPSQQLKALSRRQGVTLFMTLLAAFQTLLYRHTKQHDIVVGTDVANRNRAEIEPLIGFFINLLVLRSDLSGNPSFRELLERVREVTLGAYAHQDLPFAKLVETLRPDRATNATPLFQVLFVLQNTPGSAVEFSGLTLTPVEVTRKKSRFDLALFVQETEQGIFGNWRYRTDLFEPDAISRLSRNFEALLCNVVQNPDTRIDALEMLSESEKQQQMTQKVQREKTQFRKFKAIKPKAVSLPQKELVKTGSLQSEQSLPYVIQPDDGHDIDLADWAASKREFIELNLLKHGAVLFRGFQLNSVPEFEKVANAICPKLFGNYGDLPREGVSNKVYGSTPYPSDRAILFHNESSHMHQWPLKIWFFCMQPAQEGGETPIVDCRKVYQLLDPKLRKRLEEKRLRYVRNYIEGLDVSWQNFFHTDDKEAVEAYCRQSGIAFEWLSDNGLRTYKICPAVSSHPKTGDSVFFNQVQLHHISCLESSVRTSLLSSLEEGKLPRNVYYGDGSPIEDSVMAEIGEIYDQTKISFPWEKGDILMLDNMLVAHGRNPYVGSRKIVVAMGEMSDSQLIERV